MSGDVLSYLELPQSTDRLEDPTVEEVQTFIGQRAGEPFTLGFVRDGAEDSIEIVPTDAGEGGRGAIGVALDYIGTVRLSFFVALWEGLKTTGSILKNIAVSIAGLIGDAFRGDADISSVTGPVGIAGLVGSAARAGLIALLSFMAFISLNLAVLNLIPLPALDGGRILFVLIEKIKGSPIRPAIVQTVNMIGFGLLILFMIIVTIHDILGLF